MNAAAPLRILLSQEAAQRIAPRIRQVLQPRDAVLLSPGDADAATADVAFISRDVTGLSTKHRILSATQQFYDSLLVAGTLQWVHIHSAGADRAVYLQLMDRGVKLSTSAGVNAPVVATSAVTGVLALARQWPRLLAAQREHRWAPLLESGLPRDLRGQHAVIVGWGPIGREIGRLLQAFGVRVTAVRRNVGPPPPQPSPGGGGGGQGGAAACAITIKASSDLHSLLPTADWLVLACSLTPETRGLIGARELALLPSHAHLVNICRGEVVDEPALIDALREQRMAGAYLDVFAQEPLPPDSPLWAMPNVIATPHSAGFSDANEPAVDEVFLDNLARWARGEAPLNVLR